MMVRPEWETTPNHWRNNSEMPESRIDDALKLIAMVSLFTETCPRSLCTAMTNTTNYSWFLDNVGIYAGSGNALFSNVQIGSDLEIKSSQLSW